MNDYNDTERLLDDTLTEAAPAEFRQALLDHTLRLARRRRYTRQSRRAVLSLALVTGLLYIGWHWLGWNFGGAAKPYVLVRTESLAQEELVESRPLPMRSLIATAPTQNALTTAEAGYRTREIDDEELLVLAAPNPAVLVWHSPHNAELVVARSSEVQ